MFFQSKKKGLWKRLWKARVTTHATTSTNSAPRGPLNGQNILMAGVEDVDEHQQRMLLMQSATASIGSTMRSCRKDIDTEDDGMSALTTISSYGGGGVCGVGGGGGGGNSVANAFGNCYRLLSGGCVDSNSNNSNRNNNYGSSSSPGSAKYSEEQLNHQQFECLAKELKERQLETLCQSVERANYCAMSGNENGYGSGGTLSHNAVQSSSSGAIHPQTDCVLVQRCTIMDEQPHVIACRLWKWPDLQNASQLKGIPSCPNERDPVYVCCNPAHWSRLCYTETPPPPYCPYAMDGIQSIDDRKFSGSLTTDGEDASLSPGWCQLAYWEMAQRVGRLFPVEHSAVNVFSEQPRGDGLCLTTLAMQRSSASPDPVRRARQKIGLGVTLSRENDGVWLYNRSQAPVFVHSPTLNDVDSRTMLVHRVPPGHCLRAFDPERAATESFAWPSVIARAQTGPIDRHSVRISFAKGWGPKYSRQEVTACPCWLEVLLSPCR